MRAIHQVFRVMAIVMIVLAFILLIVSIFKHENVIMSIAFGMMAFVGIVMLRTANNELKNLEQ